MEEKPDRGLDYERIVFFSDAIFAIAITLLVIDIRLPAEIDIHDNATLVKSLLSVWPELLSYLISFFVIGTFWTAHHTMFKYICCYDHRLIWLNLLFLLFVAITPFPTRVVGQYGDLPAAQVLYALDVVLAGLTKFLLWRYATWGKRLVVADVTDRTISHLTLRSLVVPVIFLASIPLAVTGSMAPILLWWLSPLAYFLVDRRLRPANQGQGKD